MTTPDSSGSARARARVELLPTLAALVVVLAASALGTWQLMRAHEKREIQARREAANAGPAIALDASVADPAALDGLRVSVRGRYSAEHTVFIDNRTLNGVAGFHVVTPVRIDGSRRAVLVLRGWIASDPRNRTRLPEVDTPADAVEVLGIAQSKVEQSIELGATAEPGAERLWQNLDLARFQRWSGLELVPLLVRELDAGGAGGGARAGGAGSAAPPAGAALVRDWPIGGPDENRHLGYAVQWFALALLAAGGWLYYAMNTRRERTPDR